MEIEDDDWLGYKIEFGCLLRMFWYVWRRKKIVSDFIGVEGVVKRGDWERGCGERGGREGDGFRRGGD